VNGALVSGGLLLIGVTGVLAALATAARRAHRGVLLLAVAGEAVTGAAGLLAGQWPVTAGTWATGAYLAWRWASLQRKAGHGHGR